VDQVKVVVVDTSVDLLNEFAVCFEAINVTKLLFEPAKEAFLVAVLPRGGFVGDRDPYPLELQVVGHDCRHKLFALVSVEIGRETTGRHDGLFEALEDERGIMVLSHPG
jgi:hypothetical protein